VRGFKGLLEALSTTPGVWDAAAGQLRIHHHEGATLKKARLLATLGAAGALTFGGLAISSAPAFAASATQNSNTHCNPADPTCGPGFFQGIITGPPPPFVTVPANCPAWFSTDSWAVNFTDGNSVMHFTQNKNGDWGGGTATGSAVLVTSDGTVQYSGHATVWGGGGQNSNPGGNPTQQSVNGFTVHFIGSGPTGSIDIHAHSHSTTNNAGTPTANVIGASVTCS
jgi:hypothetical protein